MSEAFTSTLFDRLLDPLTDCLTREVAQRVLDLKVDPSLQARMDELADKANEGELTTAEAQEYREYIDGIDFIAIFKAKARLHLRQASS
jgi:uncharacterized protein YnzC (UPF0291/DUF896 family)